VAGTHDKMYFVSEGNATLCSAVFSYDKMYSDIHCEVKKADEQAGVLCSRKGVLL
jgi:hypothetical protein